jgi:hypothetical protein
VPVQSRSFHPTKPEFIDLAGEGDFESVICQNERNKLGSTREILGLSMGLEMASRESGTTSAGASSVVQRDDDARARRGSMNFFPSLTGATLRWLLLLLLLLLALSMMAGCTRKGDTRTNPKVCTQVGERCLHSSGKLGVCGVNDNPVECAKPPCYVCVNQH